ncbi:MAG: glycogen synthase GlgA [Deltaproteobacteria bacterium]|nr:glycogen synthase GlgA [Deltaproteobacteria bacterium]
MTAVKICLVSSEAVPYAKTGGLADVTAALASFLGSEGQDVRLFLPRYRQLETAGRTLLPVEYLQRLTLTMGGRRFAYSVWTDPGVGDGSHRYFIDCPALFHRKSLYTSDPDEHIRFAFFSRACLECCQRMGWAPDVVHCNDWHTALIPLYLKQHYSWDRLFARTRTLLAIHNIGYQGVFSAKALGDLDLEGSADLLYQEDLAADRINFLKTGLLYANGLSTVSRTYAREIQTSEYGMGLEDLLRTRADSLVGIVNGVDYGEWSPEADARIPHSYSAEDLTGKRQNKQHLLRSLDLPYDEKAPVFGLVSRLTAQKGIDLLFEPLPEMLAWRNVRLVLLGSGEGRYESFFHRLQQTFPEKVCYYRGYSEDLAHLIEAGSDVFLMPSRYEPCGLNQMYSLRYGTVPIVRKTGGLADTVQLFDPASGEGTGFVFDHYSADGVRWALSAALDCWKDQDSWRQLILNGMAKDFSWQVQGQEYLNLYRHLGGR